LYNIEPFSVLPYHIFVAQRRKPFQKSRNQPDAKSQAIVIFWLIFVIVIITVFMLNYETINRNFNLFRTRLTAPHGAEVELLLAEEEEIEEIIVPEQQPVITIEPSPVQRPQPIEERPATQTTVTPQVPDPVPQTPPAPAPQPVQTRERTIYFTQIDRNGNILHARVTRRLPVSESPMRDVLNVMFAGPSADEINRGILSLIPQNTRILSATVRGNTAYISFSEDFMFNTFGVEGYIAQLRQIVWTVTEFPNVTDVQILIEGRRLDYLGEGIWIGSPISRQSF